LILDQPFRHLRRASRACPHCKVPLGYPYWYRVSLFAVYLCVGGYIIYAGCKDNPEWFGWLFVGMPFAAVAGFMAQVFTLRVFPPKLAPHAEGNTWLKLT
jgi:hypothetical protein